MSRFLLCERFDFDCGEKKSCANSIETSLSRSSLGLIKIFTFDPVTFSYSKDALCWLDALGMSLWDVNISVESTNKLIFSITESSAHPLRLWSSDSPPNDNNFLAFRCHFNPLQEEPPRLASRKISHKTIYEWKQTRRAFVYWLLLALRKANVEPARLNHKLKKLSGKLVIIKHQIVERKHELLVGIDLKMCFPSLIRESSTGWVDNDSAGDFVWAS